MAVGSGRFHLDRIKEEKNMKLAPCHGAHVSVVAVGLMCAVLTWGSAHAQVFYRADGVPLAPDQQLIVESNNPLRFRSAPAPKMSSLGTRLPTEAEEGVVKHAKELFERSAAKAMVLIDGRTVIWQATKPPASDASLYLGFSMTKSLTALAVGKAICAKKMELDEPAERYVQELRETDIGKVSIRDLLRMAS
jgi:CubicO group peptidase (beta-lactamase class C family)